MGIIRSIIKPSIMDYKSIIEFIQIWIILTCMVLKFIQTSFVIRVVKSAQISTKEVIKFIRIFIEVIEFAQIFIEGVIKFTRISIKEVEFTQISIKAFNQTSTMVPIIIKVRFIQIFIRHIIMELFQSVALSLLISMKVIGITNTMTSIIRFIMEEYK